MDPAISRDDVKQLAGEARKAKPDVHAITLQADGPLSGRIVYIRKLDLLRKFKLHDLASGAGTGPATVYGVAASLCDEDGKWFWPDITSGYDDVVELGSAVEEIIDHVSTLNGYDQQAQEARAKNSETTTNGAPAS